MKYFQKNQEVDSFAWLQGTQTVRFVDKKRFQRELISRK
jgi:hypothetical protein